MALIACEQTSDKIGVLKEVLDAEDGGTGFSFGDLAANAREFNSHGSPPTMSTRLVRFQERLAAGFPVDAVFPEVADLPENLDRDQFQAKFGGVDGEAHRGSGCGDRSASVAVPGTEVAGSLWPEMECWILLICLRR